MAQFIQQSLQLLLDELGIDEKRQFLLFVFIALAAMVVYSVRDRHQHGLLITFLFTLLGLASLVFLFTDREAARHWSALVCSLTIAAILSWEWIRRRRAAAGGAGAAARADDAGRPAAAEQAP
jgi:FtsH-binding integral membrane protein